MTTKKTKTVKKNVKSNASFGATKTKKKKVTIIDAIYNRIEKAYTKGMTCSEVERSLRLAHNTSSGRIADLARERSIVDRGERRATKNGRQAIVWFAADVPFYA